MRIRSLVFAAVFGVLAAWFAAPLAAQEPEAPAAQPGRPADAPAEAAPADPPAAEVGPDGRPLTESQQALAARYRRFEQLLMQMSEYLRKSDPQKADLLLRAVRLSQQGRVHGQMDTIVDLLENKQLGDALERQDELVVQLRAILYLLNTHNRLDEIQAEKARIKDLLKDLGKVIGKQRDVRAATDRREDPERLAGRQEGVTDDARKLGSKIDSQDAERAERRGQTPEEPSEGKPSEGKPSEGKPSDGKPSEGKPSEGKPSEGDPSEGKPSEGKPSEGKPSEGKPSEGKPSEGKPSEGKPSEGQPSENQPSESAADLDKTAGREELEQAIQRMERAIEELRKQNHGTASKEQDEAIKKLLEMKEKLEEILRQLREEEREILLAALEARFQKMLAMQLAVYRGTVSLDKIPRENWQSAESSRSKELAQQENEIAIEANKALTLLKAEGSSVAFPEAVEQLREDMLEVARRLDEYKADNYTQEIERDIIEALEEVIEALQKELEKAKEKKDPPPPGEGQPSDPSLVDKLAELKMLRSLQLRINRRTRRIGRMIKTPEGQATETEAELVTDLKELARRQARVQEATYDLATGRNR